MVNEDDWYSKIWDDYVSQISFNRNGWILAFDDKYPPGTTGYDFLTFEEARNKALTEHENDGCVYLVVEVTRHIDIIITTSEERLIERPLKTYTVIRDNTKNRRKNRRNWFFESFSAVMTEARFRWRYQQSILKISNYTKVCG